MSEWVPHGYESSRHAISHPRAGKSCDFKLFFPLLPLPSQATQEIAEQLFPCFFCSADPTALPPQRRTSRSPESPYKLNTPRFTGQTSPFPFHGQSFSPARSTEGSFAVVSFGLTTYLLTRGSGSGRRERSGEAGKVSCSCLAFLSHSIPGDQKATL